MILFFTVFLFFVYFYPTTETVWQKSRDRVAVKSSHLDFLFLVYKIATFISISPRASGALTQQRYWKHDLESSEMFFKDKRKILSRRSDGAHSSPLHDDDGNFLSLWLLVKSTQIVFCRCFSPPIVKFKLTSIVIVACDGSPNISSFWRGLIVRFISFSLIWWNIVLRKKINS